MSTMTTINDFLPFAENADLVPFSEWQQAASRLSGFVNGLAAPGELNRAIAQGANAGYAIAKFIERTLKEDVYVSNPDLLVDQLYRAMLEMSYRATPIGCILTFPVQVEIEGFVVSNFGGDLSRIDYDKLFAVYGTKFNVSSTPETKFGIPNLAHNFLEAAGQLAEIGCFVKAGLPNIKGSINNADGGNFVADGCFRSETTPNVGYTIAADHTNGSSRQTFIASRSNSTYSDSVSTVQPAGLYGLYLIRAYQ
ncbi:tail fiber protein [Turicimonas muris]|uniref:tail fiber protein n=1 Tax=Turicimonas muris TaxID=1796652 RepID=UPI0023F43463|nr:tail fiber protein [Turicimonas muris]